MRKISDTWSTLDVSLRKCYADLVHYLRRSDRLAKFDAVIGAYAEDSVLPFGKNLAVMEALLGWCLRGMAAALVEPFDVDFGAAACLLYKIVYHAYKCRDLFTAHLTDLTRN